MTKWVGFVALCFLFHGSGSALAQQQTFGCTKICWTPATGIATCSKKLNTQFELTAYIYAVQHKSIAKGKGITFFVDLKGKQETCASSATTQGESISVVGYVNVQNVTGFTIGGLKVGDTIEIGGSGVADDQKNVLFFLDPSQK
jgi:hypothetical protein